jgi:hypothetical protein
LRPSGVNLAFLWMFIREAPCGFGKCANASFPHPLGGTTY